MRVGYDTLFVLSVDEFRKGNVLREIVFVESDYSFLGIPASE